MACMGQAEQLISVSNQIPAFRELSATFCLLEYIYSHGASFDSYKNVPCPWVKQAAMLK